MAFLSLLDYSVLLLEITSAFVGLFFWKNGPQELRILTLYLFIGLVTDVTMGVLAIGKTNNLWLMHLFTPIQFCFLIWLFSYWGKIFVKRLLRISIPFFVIFWMIMLLFFESFTQFNSYTRPVEALILIIVSGYLLYQINKEDNISIFLMPKFWIVSGTLIYFSGMIIIFALSNFLLVNSPETLLAMWVPIQTTSNITSTLMYIAGFLCLSPRFNPQQ